MPDEMLDVVNDQDVITGQSPRSLVHTKGLLHRGIHVFLFTQDGKLLVQQRSRNKDSYPLAWDCSVSEHVKTGESYDQAARRGLMEELGLEVSAIRPLVKFRMMYGPNDDEISRLYSGRVEAASVHFDPAEIEQVAYFRVDHLLNMVLLGEIEPAYWLLQLLSWYSGRASALLILEEDADSRGFRGKDAPHP
jgi:16S rRNA (adenine1518-N6/adenine1519-N6)-dimethyltransferase